MPKKQKTKKQQKTDGSNTLIIRMPAAVKRRIRDAVAAINRNRPVGLPEMTMTTFALGCVQKGLGL